MPNHEPAGEHRHKDEGKHHEQKAVQVVNDELQKRRPLVGHAEGGEELGHGIAHEGERLAELGVVHTDDDAGIKDYHRSNDEGREQAEPKLVLEERKDHRGLLPLS